MSQYPSASGSQLDRGVDRAKAKIAARMPYAAACYQAAREVGIDSGLLMQEMTRRARARALRQQKNRKPSQRVAA